MSVLSAIVVLIVLTLFLLNDVITRNERFWAFFIFFQHIPLIIFDQLGSEQIGIVYFISFGILYYMRSPKLILSKARLLNPVNISVVLIVLALISHYFIFGIDSGNTRAHETFTRVLIFNVPIILLCIFGISSNEKTMSNLMDGIIIYGLFFLVTVLFVSGLAELGVGDRASFREDFRISPLVAAKSAGLIVIASAFKAIYFNKLFIKLLSLCVMVLSFSLMFITASRAALIFLLIVMAVFYALSNDNITRKAVVIVVSALFVFLSYVVVNKLNLQIIERLADLRNIEQTIRYLRLEIAVEMILNFEMGVWGLGPFGFGHLTGLNYPHNYIAELIVDYGIPGAVSLVLLIVPGLFYSFKLIISKEDKQHAFIAVIFLYLFLTSLTSGDILSARHMHFTGIILANYIIYRSLTKKND